MTRCVECDEAISPRFVICDSCRGPRYSGGGKHVASKIHIIRADGMSYCGYAAVSCVNRIERAMYTTTGGEQYCWHCKRGVAKEGLATAPSPSQNR